MSMKAPAPTAPQSATEPTAVQIPEWDENAKSTAATTTKTHSRGANGTKTLLQDKFNTILPRSRTYLGLTRRTFLIVLACAFFALLALIIGLSVGLTKHSKS